MISKIKLPVKAGGGGLGDAVAINHAAFIASVAAAAGNIQHYRQHLQLNNNKLQQATSQALEWLQQQGVSPQHLPKPQDDFIQLMSGAEQTKWQHVIMRTYALSVMRQAAATETNVDRARNNSVAAPHASLWYTTNPTDDQLTLNNSQFAIAVRNRLGLSPYQLSRSFNQMNMIRGNVGYTISDRHNHIRDVLASLARSVNALAQVEATVTSGTRADLMLRLSQQPGVNFDVDVMVTMPTATSNLQAAQQQLGAASLGEQQKIARYAGTMDERTQQLMPFVVEAFGAIGKAAMKVLEALAIHAEQTQNADRHEFLAFAASAISVAIQQGNADLVFKQFRNRLG